MPQKRKRKRTRIKPGPVLAFALLVVLVSGFAYSPLTSVNKVSVIGVNAEDRPEIQDVLSRLNRIPWLIVNDRWVETRVQHIEAIDHANYSQNIFGRGRLQISYRVPVARVRGESP